MVSDITPIPGMWAHGIGNDIEAPTVGLARAEGRGPKNHINMGLLHGIVGHARVRCGLARLHNLPSASKSPY